MLTLEQYQDLGVGDQIETSSLMPSMTVEPVVLQVVEKAEDGTSIDFVATWFGTTLGRWSCHHKEGALSWL